VKKSKLVAIVSLLVFMITMVLGPSASVVMAEPVPPPNVVLTPDSINTGDPLSFTFALSGQPDTLHARVAAMGETPAMMVYIGEATLNTSDGLYHVQSTETISVEGTYSVALFLHLPGDGTTMPVAQGIFTVGSGGGGGGGGPVPSITLVPNEINPGDDLSFSFELSGQSSTLYAGIATTGSTPEPVTGIEEAILNTSDGKYYIEWADTTITEPGIYVMPIFTERPIDDLFAVSPPITFGTFTVVSPDANPVLITTTSLPNAVVGQYYCIPIETSGGTPAFSWTWMPAQSESLPAGLGVTNAEANQYLGRVVGTPTTAGTYHFTVTVTDSLSQFASQTYTLVVEEAQTSIPAILAVNPNSGTAGQTSNGLIINESTADLWSASDAGSISLQLVTPVLPPATPQPVTGVTISNINVTDTSIGFDMNLPDTVSAGGYALEIHKGTQVIATAGFTVSAAPVVGATAILDVSNDALRSGLNETAGIYLSMKNITFDRAEVSIKYNPALAVVSANAWCPGLSDDFTGWNQVDIDGGWKQETFRVIGKDAFTQIVQPLTIGENGDTVFKIFFTAVGVEGTVPVSLGVNESPATLIINVYNGASQVPVTVEVDETDILPGMSLLTFTDKAHVVYAVDYDTRAPIGNGSIETQVADVWQPINTSDMTIDSQYGGYFFNSPAEATAYRFLANTYPERSIDRILEWTWDQSLYHRIFTVNKGTVGPQGLFLPFDSMDVFARILANQANFKIKFIDVNVPAALHGNTMNFYVCDLNDNRVAHSTSIDSTDINYMVDSDSYYYMMDGINMAANDPDGLPEGNYLLCAEMNGVESNRIPIIALGGPVLSIGLSPYWVPAGSNTLTFTVGGYKFDENINGLTATFKQITGYDDLFLPILGPELQDSTQISSVANDPGAAVEGEFVSITFITPTISPLSAGDYSVQLYYNGTPVEALNDWVNMDFKATTDPFLYKLLPAKASPGETIRVFGANLGSYTYSIYMNPVGGSGEVQAATGVVVNSLDGEQYLEFALPTDFVDGDYTLYGVYTVDSVSHSTLHDQLIHIQAVDTAVQINLMPGFLTTADPVGFSFSLADLTFSQTPYARVFDPNTGQPLAAFTPAVCANTGDNNYSVLWMHQFITVTGNYDLQIFDGDPSADPAKKPFAIGHFNVTPTQLSSNANLSTLSLSAGTLNPAFAPGVYTYTANVINSVTFTNVTAIPVDDGATVTVNNTPVDGINPVQVNLAEGDNLITIIVTASDQSQQIYTVTVNRAAAPILSSEDRLSDLKMDGTTLNGFSPDIYLYNVELPAVTTAVPVLTYTLYDIKASAVYTAASDLPGSSIVEVTAEDGTKKTYTVNFTLLTVPNTAPTASNVLVTGNAQVGQILIASYSYFDADADAEGVSIFTWYTSDSPQGALTPINGVTGLACTLTAAELGKYIFFQVTPVAAAGILQGSPVMSPVTAQVLAQNTTIVYGDLNGENGVNSTDLGILKAYLLGKISAFPNDVPLSAADLNGVNGINSTDLGILKAYLLGKISEFPVSVQP
jgi:hypothetical protein